MLPLHENSHEVNDLHRYWVRFRSPEREHAFRQFRFPNDRIRAAILFIAALISLFFYLTLDFQQYSSGEGIFHLFVARIIAIVLLLNIAFFAFKTRDENTFDMMMLAYVVVCAFFQTYVHSFRPPGFIPAYLMEMLMLLTFYLVMPGRLVIPVAGAFILTVGSVSMLVEVPGMESRILIFGLVLANGIGLAFAVMWHRSSRIYYGWFEDTLRLKENLEKSQDRYRLLFYQSPVGVVLLEQSGAIAQCNDYFADMLGASYEELVGSRISDEMEIPEIRKVVDDALAGKEGEYDGPFTSSVKSKEVRIKAQVRPLVSPDGKIDGAIGILKDVTREWEAELALRASEEKYRHVVENVNVGIIVAQNHKLVFTNSAISNTLGYTQEEILNNPNPFEFVHPEDQEMVLEKYASRVSAQEDNPDVYSFRVVTKSGDIRWVDVAGIRIMWKGAPAALNFYSDITERKAAVEKMEELNSIINRSPIVVFVWKNQDGWPVEYVSDNVESLTGYSAGEMLTQKFMYADLVHPDDLERVFQNVKARNADDDVDHFPIAPYRILHKDGGIKWVEDLSYVCRNEQGKITHHQGGLHDVTAKHMAEEALKDQSEILRGILSASPVAICLLHNRTIIMANREFEILFGFASREQYLNKNTRMLYATEEEYIRAGKDVYQVRNSSSPFERDILLQRKNGEEFIGHVRARFHDPANPLDKSILTITDVSWRMEAEKERLNKEKLQGVIETAGAVCHELNQPLQIVTGYAQLLEMSLDEYGPAMDKLQLIIEQIDRMGAITRKLMGVTRYETKKYLDGRIIDIDKAADPPMPPER